MTGQANDEAFGDAEDRAPRKRIAVLESGLMPRIWRENDRARRRLCQYASLDPRFLKDIGLTPAEFATICAAPPWKAVVRAGERLAAGHRRRGLKQDRN